MGRGERERERGRRCARRETGPVTVIGTARSGGASVVVVVVSLCCCCCCCCWFRRLHYVCVCPLHILATQRGLLKSHAQPGDVGIRMTQLLLANPSPVLHKSITLITLMHTPCLGISMKLTRMILNPQSLPNTWPRLNPQNTTSHEVCRSFSV